MPERKSLSSSIEDTSAVILRIAVQSQRVSGFKSPSDTNPLGIFRAGFAVAYARLSLVGDMRQFDLGVYVCFVGRARTPDGAALPRVSTQSAPV